MPDDAGADRADKGWDDYAARVLRNEGRLAAIEDLVRETRASDTKLIEQRSESLAKELERRANALQTLNAEERDADRRSTALLREMYDVAIKKNYEQSQDAIRALEQRGESATSKIEQLVHQWRKSDKEARELFSKELDKHLDQLNHSTERMTLFQANSVTRELWQSEKDASIQREGLLRDQIITIDRMLLTMTPIASSDKAHGEMVVRMESSIAAAALVLENKIATVSEKVADLKEYRDKTQGRSSGYTAVYAWVATGITIVVSVIVLANAFLGGGAP